MADKVAADVLARLRERDVGHVCGYHGDGSNGLPAAREQTESTAKSAVRGDPDRGQFVRQSFQAGVQRFRPGNGPHRAPDER